MNKIFAKLAEVVSMLFGHGKQLRDIQAALAHLEAEQQRQGAILEEIRDAVVLDEAVTLDLTAGPAEEQST